MDKERDIKRRSDMGVLTHSDPSPCFTSGIMGIYTLAQAVQPPYISPYTHKHTHSHTHIGGGAQGEWYVLLSLLTFFVVLSRLYHPAPLLPLLLLLLLLSIRSCSRSTQTVGRNRNNSSLACPDLSPCCLNTVPGLCQIRIHCLHQ